jgi:hypothetical protein
LNEEVKRKTRGVGKKPALFNTSVRLPREVVDYFAKHYPFTKQAKMREVLVNFINQEKQNGKTNS